MVSITGDWTESNRNAAICTSPTTVVNNKEVFGVHAE